MLATTSCVPKDVSEFPLCVFAKNGNYKVCIKNKNFEDLEEQESRIQQITICFLESFFTDPEEVLGIYASPAPTCGKASSNPFKLQLARNKMIKSRFGKLSVKDGKAQTLTIRKKHWSKIFNENIYDENYEIRVLLEVQDQDQEKRIFHLKDLKIAHFDRGSESSYQLQFHKTVKKLENEIAKYAENKRNKAFSVQVPKVLIAGSSQNRNFWDKIVSSLSTN